MGAPSDQFLHYISLHASLCLFSYYKEPLGSFLCILYWGPQITFFACYMGSLRSVSSHTIWGPLSDQFHCLLYRAPLRSVSLHAIGRPPHILFFSPNIWGPADQFLRLLYGPRVTIGLVCLLTIYGVPSCQFLCILFGGPSQISFFAYYMGGPSDQFLRLLYGGPLRSVSSLTIWYGIILFDIYLKHL